VSSQCLHFTPSSQTRVELHQVLANHKTTGQAILVGCLSQGLNVD
jgi:hypothetical protein